MKRGPCMCRAKKHVGTFTGSSKELGFFNLRSQLNSTIVTFIYLLLHYYVTGRYIFTFSINTLKLTKCKLDRILGSKRTFSLMVFFGPMVIFNYLLFICNSIYSVLWIRSTGPARSALPSYIKHHSDSFSISL